MKLSYVDLLGDGQRHEMPASITTEHPASHYSQPVILLEDGEPLDLSSWMLLNYQVTQADQEELAMLKQWLSWIDLVTQDKQEAAAKSYMSRGGQSRSERKQAAARENGKKGGRPKKSKE